MPMDTPFRANTTYRVLRDFKSYRDEFRAGELLVYRRRGDSSYDSMTGFFFTPVGGGEYRAWDVAWDDDVGVWRELFEPVVPKAG